MRHTNSALALGGIHHIFTCHGFSSFFLTSAARFPDKRVPRAPIRPTCLPATEGSNDNAQGVACCRLTRSVAPPVRHPTFAADAAIWGLGSAPRPSLLPQRFVA